MTCLYPARMFRETQKTTASFGSVASGRIVHCPIVRALMFLTKTILGLVGLICSNAEIVQSVLKETGCIAA